MNVTLITHSSDNGLNFRQMMEIMNIIGWDGIKIQSFIDPLKVSHLDILQSDKIIMIVPEWNGSIPWTFKKMIDDSGWPSSLSNKDILLIGTSSTTFGNVMGISHLQHILEWIGGKVYHKRLCIPQIDEKFNNNNIIVNDYVNSSVIDFINTKNIPV